MSHFSIPCDNGLILQVRTLQHGIFRVTASGIDTPDPSLFERYRIVEEPSDDPSATLDGRIVLLGDQALEILPDGGWILRKAGKIVAQTAEGTRPASAVTEKQNAGWTLSLQSDPGLHYLGLGDIQRRQVSLNGLSGELWLMAPQRHIPIPFLMNSRGLGLFFNTTRSVYFDICKTDPTRAVFGCKKAFFDAWIFAGSNYFELLDTYTRLSGRPHLPPVKSFGLWLTVYYYSTANDLHSIANTLRDKEIPCDNLALDPGWMSKNYDFSADKDWHLERFNPCPLDLWRGPAQEMMAVLKTLGYNFGLWLCCSWDFTYEEEQRLAKKTPSDTAPAATFGVPESSITFLDKRTCGRVYQDTFTRREEPYFEHLKKFVDDGVDFFKLDGSNLQNEYPDRLYGNGKTDEEMHNLAFLLESRHTFEDYEAYTHKRSYGISPCGTAGVQRYGGTWCGDTAGDKTALTGMLQDGICGHAFTTCDMNNRSIPGVHLGALLPWSYIDCWAICHYPGYLTRDLNDATRDYLNLRMSLIPYYYSLAHHAHQTGTPLIRPLFFTWPDHDWAYHDLGICMLGEHILFDAFSSDEIRLPPGRWYDVWSGTIYRGNGEIQHIPFPANRGGHLFLREGAVIPTMPPAQYITPGSLPSIEWLLFPREDSAPTSFTLYWDDGVSLRHRSGDFATQTATLQGSTFTLGPIGGNATHLATTQNTTKVVGYRPNAL